MKIIIRKQLKLICEQMIDFIIKVTVVSNLRLLTDFFRLKKNEYKKSKIHFT